MFLLVGPHGLALLHEGIETLDRIGGGHEFLQVDLFDVEKRLEEGLARRLANRPLGIDQRNTGQGQELVDENPRVLGKRCLLYTSPSPRDS